MLSVISAEALKLRGHRATWFLVWIFPIGALIIPLLMILSQLIQNSPPAPAAPTALDARCTTRCTPVPSRRAA